MSKYVHSSATLPAWYIRTVYTGGLRTPKLLSGEIGNPGSLGTSPPGQPRVEKQDSRPELPSPNNTATGVSHLVLPHGATSRYQDRACYSVTHAPMYVHMPYWTSSRFHRRHVQRIGLRIPRHNCRFFRQSIATFINHTPSPDHQRATNDTPPPLFSCPAKRRPAQKSRTRHPGASPAGEPGPHPPSPHPFWVCRPTQPRAASTKAPMCA